MSRCNLTAAIAVAAQQRGLHPEQDELRRVLQVERRGDTAVPTILHCNGPCWDRRNCFSAPTAAPSFSFAQRFPRGGSGDRHSSRGRRSSRHGAGTEQAHSRHAGTPVATKRLTPFSGFGVRAHARNPRCAVRNFRNYLRQHRVPTSSLGRKPQVESAHAKHRG